MEGCQLGMTAPPAAGRCSRELLGTGTLDLLGRLTAVSPTSGLPSPINSMALAISYLVFGARSILLGGCMEFRERHLSFLHHGLGFCWHLRKPRCKGDTGEVKGQGKPREKWTRLVAIKRSCPWSILPAWEREQENTAPWLRGGKRIWMLQ